MFEDLLSAIASRSVILFVGSGVSVGLGLPSWRDLIRHMASETGLGDLEPSSTDNYRMIAEYYRIKKGSIGSLRSWMDRAFSADANVLRNSAVLELLVALDFPIIYTTNFDRNLEEAYRVRGKPFTKITNAKDIARAEPTTTQIVKFHGDFDDDSSIVLTETDYFDRLNFESPLDIKLRSDALGKPILFIGYSLSDVNIRLLLHKMWRTWRGSGYEKDRPTSYVFAIKSDPVQEAVLAQWGIVTLSQPAPVEHALEAFLGALRSDLQSRLASR